MNTYFKRSFIAGTAALCTLTAALPTLPTYAEDIATPVSYTHLNGIRRPHTGGS